MKVHSALGPGLLESAYKYCLLFELHRRGIKAVKEIEMPVVYEGVTIELDYKLDLLVDDRVVVEIKAVNEMHPVFEAQLLSYLKLGKFQVGFLINFHEMHLKNGIKRMVNKL
jgi:GxxExxY protein